MCVLYIYKCIFGFSSVLELNEKEYVFVRKHLQKTIIQYSYVMIYFLSNWWMGVKVR